MTRSIKILNILIVFLWLGLTSCSKNSTNSDTENNERKAPGLLHFLTANPTRIYQYDILGDQLKVIVDEANSHEYFSVSYDGSTLAYISRDSSIGVIDLPTLGSKFFTSPDRPGEEITVDQFGSSAAFTALRNSGSIILYKTNDTHTIYRSNLSGTEKEILAGPLSPASAFAPSPDGRFLAYFNSDPDSTRLIIQNLDEKRNVVDKNLPLGSNNYVETVYWRNKPNEGG